MIGAAPLVSVVTPTHNRAQLLRRAMASLQAQTRSDFEWIVVDDGSSDETPEVLDRCDDYRLVRVRLDSNRGVASARNAGLQRARGELVAFLDDDDEYLPGYLEAVVAAFATHPDRLDVLWTGVERVFEQPDGTARSLRQVWDCSASALRGSALRFLTQLNLSCGLCMRRDSLARIHPFDEAMTVSEDTDLLLRLASAGCRFGCVPRALIRVHVHLASSLSRGSRSAVMAACNARLVQKNHAFLERHPPLWLHFHDMLAGDYYRARELAQARRVIREMLRRAPLRAKTWEKWLRFELLKRKPGRG